jgi:predicted O-linked N-acetylglucosamine transferase (SPINDLY family)
MLLCRSGQHEQALPHLEAACRMAPDRALIHNNLGTALLVLGRWSEAAKAYRRAITLDPGVPEIWMALANAELEMERCEEALRASEEAMRLDPKDTRIVECRMRVLARACRVDDAVSLLEDGLRQKPGDRRLLGSLAFHLNYLTVDPARTLDAHRRFGQVLPRPAPPPRPSALAGRRLRIGILSSDLRSHAVGCFAQAILAMDPTRAELVAFSNAPAHADDPRTHGLRARVSTWHEVLGLEDDALEQLLRDSKLDVLMELNGLSEGERLSTVARKPVARIVTAIGYPNTTGVPAIDARLVDSLTDPPGSEGLCSERLLRLDPCFLCYDPPEDAPEPSMPPPGTPFTFGSFNNAMKISDHTATLWAAALRAVPGSRLLLESAGFGDASVRNSILGRLAVAGIAPDRVEACGPVAGASRHLEMYRRVHVALDTVPYNGTTTTCEALWMGVPVVALRGDRHAARVSSSLLSAAGHPEWIADDADAFARIAADLATDSSGLARTRATLRAAMRRSPLMDAARWADGLLRLLHDLYCEAP